MADWQTLSTEIVYKTPWLEIVQDKATNHNGKELTYSFLRLPHPAVTVVAVDDQNRILLQKNYRYPLKSFQWEIPAGHSDGEDPLEAAKRELLEESGLESNEWSSLGEARLACGVADVHHYLFLARNVRQVTDERDEDEDIAEQRFVPLAEVKEMILNNQILDGDSLIGLYRYMLMKEEK